MHCKDNINSLVSTIKRYKSYKKQHKKDELYLANILKK